ncbi:C40 family peptidase [Jatrophihabitans sp. YIM 134969]
MAAPDGGAAPKVGLSALAVLVMSTVLIVVAGAGANASPSSNVCGGAGTGQTVGTIALDAEQLGNARTVVSVVAGRHLPVFAAVVAVATAYTESTLHNSSAQSDHDSEGLFQQRVSIYTEVVAIDPVRATNAFLDRLVEVPGWLGRTVGDDAQTVQISQHPERYDRYTSLAQQVVGQLWPTAAAAAVPPPTPSDTTAAATPAIGAGPAICAGGGGAVPGGGGVAGSIVGPHGNNVAGTTTVPPGFVISGSTTAAVAVRFALAQLGKPYVFAAAGPTAFDCSGLTMAAWATAGVALPHLAAAQTAAGTAGLTDLSQAVGGDLVMIPGADGTAANPGHVGMIAGYADEPDGRHLFIVQAPMSGIPVELTEATEWSGQISDVRHIA